MSKLKLGFGAFVAAAMLGSPASAATTLTAAPSFTSLTVFGDSLVDAGTSSR